MPETVTNSSSRTPQSNTSSLVSKPNNSEIAIVQKEKITDALQSLKALSINLDKNPKLLDENPNFKKTLTIGFMVLVKLTSLPVAKALLEDDKTSLNPAIKQLAKEFFANIPEDLAKPPNLKPENKLPENPEERMKLIKESEEFKTINSMDKKLDEALMSHELLGPLHSLMNKGYSKDEIQSAAVGTIKGDNRLFDAMNIVFTRIETQMKEEKLAAEKAKQAKTEEKKNSGGIFGVILAPIKAIIKALMSLISGGKK